MNKNIYTHIPVIEEGESIGIFSENTIFSYIVEKQEMLLISLDFLFSEANPSKYLSIVFLPQLNLLVSSLS